MAKRSKHITSIICLLFACFIFMAPIAQAQGTMSTSSGMGASQSSNARLQAELANEKNKRETTDTNLQKVDDAIKACQNSGKIYAPSHGQADADGCIATLTIDSSGNILATKAVRADAGLEVTGTSTISGVLKVTDGSIETAGTIKIGGDTATCAGSNDKGSLRYNSSTNKVEFCDGNSWAEFGVGGAGAGSTGEQCDSPFNATNKIDHGASIIAFQASHVPYSTACGMQIRTCLDGNLGGSYASETCVVDPPLDCNSPWGGTIPHGGSLVAYQASSVPCGDTCTTQSRVCTNGVLSGNYAYQSCAPSCASCNLPWGGSITHGNSVQAYAASVVGCGGSCAAQTRTCSNGTLSGSYGYASCYGTGCASCSGGHPHGSCWGAGCSAGTWCCSNGSTYCSSGTCVDSCPTWDPCFAAGAHITMADGSVKKIQLVKAGDMVRGQDGSVNTVKKLIAHTGLPDGKLYVINNHDFRVTNNHPILTTDGWKTIKGGKVHGMDTTALKVGDMLVKLDGTTEKVTDITGYNADNDTRTFNLEVDGNHTYVVDGIVVHNKSA